MWKDAHEESYLFLFYSILAKCETSSNSSIVTRLWLRLPLTHIKADLRIRNDNLYRMVEIIFSYLSPVLIANRSATCLWNIEHSLTIPPETEKTDGVKVPCSVFIIRLLKFRFFSCSCFFRRISFVRWICDEEWVFVTLTSKKAFWPALHTPLALISGLEAFRIVLQ